MSIRVTVRDLDDPDPEHIEFEDIENDYIVTTAGTAYVDHVQVFKNGTHVVTIKGRQGR